MKKRIALAVGIAALCVAGTASAQLFEVWGHGISAGAAIADAQATANTLCRNQGYSGAFVEIVDTVNTGGGVIAYGLAECFTL